MPLSKVRNRERMREFRLHRQHCPPQRLNDVQPKPVIKVEVDADGQPIYDD